MHALYRWSGLWRPLSLHISYHRILMLCMAGAFVVAAGAHMTYHAAVPEAAMAFGLRISMAIFFSWAICRELHPDAPWAAFVAIGLATAGLWIWPRPNLLLLLQILLLTRLMNRSSGVKARIADVVFLLLLTAWLLLKGDILAGVLATLAFWVNSRQPQPQPMHQYLALLLLLLSLSTLYHKPEYINFKTLSIETNILIISLATGFALFSRKLEHLHSTADLTGETLSLSRLRITQLVTLMVATVFSLWYGDALFRELIPVWAAFGGIFLYAAFEKASG